MNRKLFYKCTTAVLIIMNSIRNVHIYIRQYKNRDVMKNVLNVNIDLFFASPLFDQIQCVTDECIFKQIRNKSN